MERIPEPELMDEPHQARAYAEADFGAPHAHLMEVLAERLGEELSGPALDLGCGPGDVTFRLLARYPGLSVTAVDGAEAMLALGRDRAHREGIGPERLKFVAGMIPGVALAGRGYRLIVSTSFLHHLTEPAGLWQTVLRYGEPGTRVFVWDLKRPVTEAAAAVLTDVHAAGEPEVLRRDFHRSLMASFTPGEVEAQLAAAGVNGLTVEPVSDRHLVVSGVLA